MKILLVNYFLKLVCLKPVCLKPVCLKPVSFLYLVVILPLGSFANVKAHSNSCVNVNIHQDANSLANHQHCLKFKDKFKLSFKDFIKQAKSEFKELDTNNNKKLNKDEFSHKKESIKNLLQQFYGETTYPSKSYTNHNNKDFDAKLNRSFAKKFAKEFDKAFYAQQNQNQPSNKQLDIDLKEIKDDLTIIKNELEESVHDFNRHILTKSETLVEIAKELQKINSNLTSKKTQNFENKLEDIIKKIEDKQKQNIKNQAYELNLNLDEINGLIHNIINNITNIDIDEDGNEYTHLNIGDVVDLKFSDKGNILKIFNLIFDNDKKVNNRDKIRDQLKIAPVFLDDFLKYDLNDNNNISLREYLRKTKKTFKQIDKNQDKYIDFHELMGAFR